MHDLISFSRCESFSIKQNNLSNFVIKSLLALLSKIKCEKIIVENLKFSQTKYCILRFFNVASSLKEKKIGEIHNPETHLIPILINSLHYKKNIHIYGNKYKTKDGTCLRDYIHIYDILSGIKKSINFLRVELSIEGYFLALIFDVFLIL